MVVKQKIIKWRESALPWSADSHSEGPSRCWGCPRPQWLWAGVPSSWGHSPRGQAGSGFLFPCSPPVPTTVLLWASPSPAPTPPCLETSHNTRAGPSPPGSLHPREGLGPQVSAGPCGQETAAPSCEHHSNCWGQATSTKCSKILSEFLKPEGLVLNIDRAQIY